MSICSADCPVSSPTKTSWRTDAARIVEELFRCTPSNAWDMLLDLREHLLRGDNWEKTLDLFLACRERLEAEHYLPFYRLRRLIANSLKLEAGTSQAQVAPLREILRRKHRSLADIKRSLRREIFEHDLRQAGTDRIPLRVVER